MFSCSTMVTNSCWNSRLLTALVSIMYMQPTDPVWTQTPQARPAALGVVLVVTGVITLWAGFAPINLLGLIPGLLPLVEWLRVATLL